ncbi:MAG: DUF2799 domain-containing protein [Ahrensia sp.]
MRSTAFGFAAIGLVIIGLSGCATLNEDQCAVTDWQQLGQSDGARGLSPDRIASHREACSKFNLPVDAPAWQAGWQLGIRQYCTFENGIEIGQRGSFGSNFCPVDLAEDFRIGNQAGKRVADARSQRDNAQREVSRLTSALGDEADPVQRQVLLAQLEGQQSLLASYNSNLQNAQAALQTLLLTRARTNRAGQVL